jgi:hypothetical protein
LRVWSTDSRCPPHGRPPKRFSLPSAYFLHPRVRAFFTLAAAPSSRHTPRSWFGALSAIGVSRIAAFRCKSSRSRVAAGTSSKCERSLWSLASSLGAAARQLVGIRIQLVGIRIQLAVSLSWGSNSAIPCRQAAFVTVASSRLLTAHHLGTGNARVCMVVLAPTQERAHGAWRSRDT